MNCCYRSGRMGLIASIAAALATLSIAWVATSNDSYAPKAVADDVISGSWVGVAESDAFPEDLELWVTLEMGEDGSVEGIFGTPDGDAPFIGHYDAEANLLTGEVTPEDANWELELTLDGDELAGPATETNSGLTAEVTLERSE